MSRFSKTGVPNRILCLESWPWSWEKKASRQASPETQYALNQNAGLSRLKYQAAATVIFFNAPEENKGFFSSSCGLEKLLSPGWLRSEGAERRFTIPTRL